MLYECSVNVKKSIQTKVFGYSVEGQACRQAFVTHVCFIGHACPSYTIVLNVRFRQN